MLPGSYRLPATYGYVELIEFLIENNCPFNGESEFHIYNGNGGDAKNHQRIKEIFDNYKKTLI